MAHLMLFELEGVSAEGDAFYWAERQKMTDLIRNRLFSYPGAAEASPPGLSTGLLAHGLLGAMYQLAKEWTHVGLMAHHLQAMGIGTWRPV